MLKDETIDQFAVTANKSKNETLYSGMNYEWTNPNYRVYLNWGIFDNATDNSTLNIYGAQNELDANNFTFYVPSAAV